MASGRSPAKPSVRIAKHLLREDRSPIVRLWVTVFRAPPTATILRAPIRHRATGGPDAVSHRANPPTSLTNAGTAEDRSQTQIVSKGAEVGSRSRYLACSPARDEASIQVDTAPAASRHGHHPPQAVGRSGRRSRSGALRFQMRPPCAAFP